MQTPIRVLIVDDSVFFRFNLRKRLGQDASIEIVGEARDGLGALEKVVAVKPDVVTLDVEMPRLNGLDALNRIMVECPTRVIMLSSLTQAGAAVTIEALERGALDFVAKPSEPGGLGLQPVIEELGLKIRAAASARLRVPLARRPIPPPVLGNAPAARELGERAVGLSRLSARRGRASLVVIGSSTGGPRALSEVVPRLPPDFPAGIVVVQHMPAGFTRALAQRLNSASQVNVKEAEPGDRVRPGLALVAPGGQHLRITAGGGIALNQDPPCHGVRPAVDPTMESAAEVYGATTIGVVLTGMGVDGSAGAMTIKRAGGKVIAEDASTCIVYGMPRAAVEAGAVDTVVPLDHVADEIMKLV